jgi:hypothetical protein
VNNTFTAHTIRKSVISLTALAMLSLPLISSAAATTSNDANQSLLNSEWQPVIDHNSEAVYGKLKMKSRDLCGSSDLRIAGGIQKSREIDQCYRGTLTAAVQRLDNPEVTSLHYQ